MSTATTPDTDPASPAQPKLTERDRHVLDNTFSLDSRALSVVRILLASLLLVEALILESGRPRDPNGVFDFLAQYGDVVVIPFAVMMLLGWKTRWAVALAWLAYSMRIRADLLHPEMAVDVGDYILTLALFWSIFLPMGRHLSLDAKGRGNDPVRFLSVASAALIFQIFIIYFSAGITKHMGEWVADATALQTILANPKYETTLGVAMLQYPTVLAVMSVATIALELFGSILILVPGKTLHTRRMIVVPMFIALHAGIGAFMGLGLFPYVCMAVWLVLLPPRFWDRVWSWFRLGATKTELMMDRSRWRNWTAFAAVVVATVSNIITWLYFPDLVGFSDTWQDMANYLVLYQQWAMFSMPSSLA
jgi:hypothetical protein